MSLMAITVEQGLWWQLLKLKAKKISCFQELELPKELDQIEWAMELSIPLPEVKARVDSI